MWRIQVYVLVSFALASNAFAGGNAHSLEKLKALERAALARLSLLNLHELALVEGGGLDHLSPLELEFIRKRELRPALNDSETFDYYRAEVRKMRIEQKREAAEAIARRLLAEYGLAIDEGSVFAIANSLFEDTLRDPNEANRMTPSDWRELKEKHPGPAEWWYLDKQFPFTRAQVELILSLYAQMKSSREVEVNWYQRLTRIGFGDKQSQHILREAEQRGYFKFPALLVDQAHCCKKWKDGPGCANCPINVQRIKDNQARVKADPEQYTCEAVASGSNQYVPERLLIYQ